jgi:hypothetical protein
MLHQEKNVKSGNFNKKKRQLSPFIRNAKKLQAYRYTLYIVLNRRLCGFFRFRSLACFFRLVFCYTLVR